jgi:hypothetical protein
MTTSQRSVWVVEYLIENTWCSTIHVSTTRTDGRKLLKTLKTNRKEWEQSLSFKGLHLAMRLRKYIADPHG